MKISTFAPASVANFIVGFDTLGAAIASIDGELFGDIVTLESADHFSFELTGVYSHHLPVDINKNITTLCCDAFHKILNTKEIAKKTFRLHLEKRLPVASGLGSSASSIVATLLALNQFYDQILSKKQLLLLAGEMEGIISGTVHYDNVAPSLLGGLQLMISNKNDISQKLPFFDDWLFVIYYPGITISTHYAREILPNSFSLSDATHYWQKLASFVHGLYQKDKVLITALLHDDLIEPYRTKLVPNFEIARTAALDAGAFAFGLSGSGPTCFALTDSINIAQQIQTAIEKNMPPHDQAFSRICTLDQQGARLLGEIN